MDAGDLVPDDLIVAMAGERLREPDAEDGFILDGFPRTLDQAGALDRQLKEQGRHITAAILIDVPDEEVVRRLSGRRVCVKNGHNYHIEFDPPKREGVCDQDGSRLIQRDDDKPEVVRNRLAVYHDQTEPLISYYDQQGLMRRIDGTRSPDEVHDHIRAVIATLRLEDDV
jgi:adenylate kinase